MFPSDPSDTLGNAHQGGILAFICPQGNIRVTQASACAVWTPSWAALTFSLAWLALYAEQCFRLQVSGDPRAPLLSAVWWPLQGGELSVKSGIPSCRAVCSPRYPARCPV